MTEEQEKSKETQPKQKKQEEDNVIFIGDKPFKAYS